MINPITYFKQVREELQKVTWPTRQQAIQQTGLVILVSVLVGVYIGGLDFIFTALAQAFIK